MKTRTLLIALLVLAISGFRVSKALASDEPEGGVARVSLINGEVSTMRGDSGDWMATTVNAPLAQGDKVSTGLNSRAEIQLDHSNIIRLDQQTEVRIATLSNARIQVQVARGRLNFTLLSGNEADVEIDTPNVALRPLEEGIYRLQVNSDSETEIICRKGKAEILTPEGSSRIGKNDQIIVRGTENAQYRIVKAPGNDDWDRWNKDRDHVISDAQSWEHANRYYTGTHELDRYGSWDDVPGYGSTWAPNSVDSSWSPYSLGSWVWQPYWGWTWVSSEPWGWAPYHYGRWFVHGGNWRWWPGPVYSSYRPLWAPAYVSFLGFGFGGHNWGFGFGFGYNSIGWLPVGPCDQYYPWYGARHGYGYNAVNITNVTNIRNTTNIYNGSAVGPLADRATRPYYSNVQSALTNEKVRRSVNSMPTEEFVKGGMANPNRTAVDARTLRQAQLVAGTVPAVPTHDSLRPVNRAVNPASLPTRAAGSERYYSRSQPAAAPQPFEQRAAEIRQMVQRYNPQVPSGQKALPPNGSGVTGPAPSTTVGPATRESLMQGSSNRQSTNRNPGSTPRVGSPATQTAPSPSWSRFGTGQPSPRNTSSDNLQQRSGVAAAPGSAPVSRGVSNPGVQTNTESSSPVRSAPGSGNGVAPQPQRVPDASLPRTDWRRFSPQSNVERQRTPTASAPLNYPSSNRVYSPSNYPSPQSVQGNMRGTPSQGPVDNRNWNRFPSASGTTSQSQRPNQINRYSRPEMSQPPVRQYTPAPVRQYVPAYQPQSQGTNQINRYSRPEMSQSPVRQYTPAPARQYLPTYRDSQPRVERPPLQMSKPIVTERAPRSYDSGGSRGNQIERQAPAPQRGGGSYSSPSSHSSGQRGKR